MKPKNCLIFGGSGQIGRNLIRKLTKNNIKVTVVTRNIHQKSYVIKTQANAGFIDIVESNIYEEKKIRAHFENADMCINLIGILFACSLLTSPVFFLGVDYGRSLNWIYIFCLFIYLYVINFNILISREKNNFFNSKVSKLFL